MLPVAKLICGTGNCCVHGEVRPHDVCMNPERPLRIDGLGNCLLCAINGKRAMIPNLPLALRLSEPFAQALACGDLTFIESQIARNLKKDRFAV